ncbi:MAG: 16S rRNA (uracil(1498)-N(3))-methyltransferase [Chromatiales bacterium]|jgi:16S rRNA (uracil1498-N3)-methyltransferase
MRLRRLHVAVELRSGATIDLPERSARHAAQVLRMRAGDEAIGFDGQGRQFRIRLVSSTRHGVRAEVIEEVSPLPESPLQITLAHGLSRREKMDWVMQKATELGVARIVPVITERSVVRLDSARADKRLAHWEAVIAHACEQSGRAVLPLVSHPIRLGDFLAERNRDDAGIVLDPDSPTRLADIDLSPVILTLLVGPEGGLTRDEAEAAQRNGFIAAAIGPRTLRTETAALTGLALAQARWGDL